jgi:hypothetical protein
MIAWIGNVLLLGSMWQLGKKQRSGWITQAIGAACWGVEGWLTGNLALVFIEAVFVVVNLYNFNKWKESK